MGEGCCSPKKNEPPSCCASPKGAIDYLFWVSAALVLLLLALPFFAPTLVADLLWLTSMTSAVHDLLASMWWGVAIGAVFIGLLAKVPQGFIPSLLGKGGTLSGLGRAVGAGVLLDLCSHGILMVGMKLYQRGASAGQVVAFLLASPWNSFSLTLILIGLIGWKLTLLFIALSMVIALVTGWVFDRLVAHGKLPNNPHSEEMPDDFAFWSAARTAWKAARFDGRFFLDVLWGGAKDSRMVLRWLLLGVLIVAVMRAFVSADVFANAFGPTFAGLLLTLVFATVMEVCSEGSTPIAADIVTRAAAPGNGFAFLMAGVATDYTEIMVLKDTTKSWKLALFLPLITVPQVLLVGWVVNQFG